MRQDASTKLCIFKPEQAAPFVWTEHENQDVPTSPENPDSEQKFCCGT